MAGTRLPTTVLVEPASRVAGVLRVPGDKSIAHRAVIIAALASGRSRLTGLPDGADVRATITCLRRLGCDLARDGASVTIETSGLAGWRSPKGVLDCANSGTTMRVLTGVLAGSHAAATLTGDASLRARPMDRVVEPLRTMGARIRSSDGHAPLRIDGIGLQGAEHVLAQPSAQAKTALLLAGLHAASATTVREPYASRDHTERLLRAGGAKLVETDGQVRIEPQDRPLNPLRLSIPGDLSSAAFFLAAAALRPGWQITVVDVGLNPSRTAFLDILEAMGARVQVEVEVEDGPAIEPRGRVTVQGGSALRAIELGPNEVARAIDEIPVLLVVASQAAGITRIAGAGELRFKESDRLKAMADGMRRMGVRVEEGPDWIAVEGPAALTAARVNSAGDHRVAMAMAVGALVAQGPVTIDGADSVSVSYPGFFRDLGRAVHG